MKTNTFCTICQRPCSQKICDTCQIEWGQTASWIQDLKTLEEHYRKMTDDDDEVIAFHIDVVGHVRRGRNNLRASSVGEILKHQADDTDWDMFEDIRLWAKRGGLTQEEYNALGLMRLGLSGPQAAEMIYQYEHKHITPHGYRKRLQMAVKKIRRAFANYTKS